MFYHYRHSEYLMQNRKKENIGEKGRSDFLVDYYIDTIRPLEISNIILF